MAQPRLVAAWIIAVAMVWEDVLEFERRLASKSDKMMQGPTGGRQDWFPQTFSLAMDGGIG